jgi:hypothetical protein
VSITRGTLLAAVAAGCGGDDSKSKVKSWKGYAVEPNS